MLRVLAQVHPNVNTIKYSGIAANAAPIESNLITQNLDPNYSYNISGDYIDDRDRTGRPERPYDYSITLSKVFFILKAILSFGGNYDDAVEALSQMGKASSAPDTQREALTTIVNSAEYDGRYGLAAILSSYKSTNSSAPASLSLNNNIAASGRTGIAYTNEAGGSDHMAFTVVRWKIY